MLTECYPPLVMEKLTGETQKKTPTVVYIGIGVICVMALGAVMAVVILRVSSYYDDVIDNGQFSFCASIIKCSLPTNYHFPSP